MHRRLALFVTLATSAMVLALQPAGPSFAQEPASSGVSSGPDIPDSATNRALDLLARRLAVAVSSNDVRQTLHSAIAKRFDGDTDALWSSLAEKSDFNGRVAAVASHGRASREWAQQIASDAQKLPRLQVAVPKTFDSWDARAYTPLVTFVPEGIDDTKLKTVTAYDAQGNAVLLDAQVAPKEPVIVVGLNERTDEHGQLKVAQPIAQTSALTQSTAVAAARSRVQVGVRIVHLVHDKEPWVKGSAEIAAAARSRGCSGVNYEDYDWDNLNHDDDWWAPGGRRVLGSTKCDVVFAWWEDDGGSWNFELTYGKFGFGIGMDDDDDMIGKVQLSYASFKGATMHKYDGWSALKMWTD